MFCCVKGCSSKPEGFADKVKFYRIPAVVKYTHKTYLNKLSQLRRKKWLTATNRNDLSKTELKNARVCSRHFISGEPARLVDNQDVDWVPSLNLCGDRKKGTVMKNGNKGKMNAIILKEGFGSQHEWDTDDPQKPTSHFKRGTRRRTQKNIPNLDLCRICLSGSPNTSGFEELLCTDGNISILDALEKVMGCHITLKENCPKHVCSMCLSLLRISYNLRIQFEESQKKLGEDLLQSSQEKMSDVEIIVANEKYDLKDIVIVEEQKEEKEDYSKFLDNLGKNITVKFVGPTPKEFYDVDVEEQNDVDVEEENDVEYETIVIQTVPEDDGSFHWEHEYAMSTYSEIPRRKVGRQSKFSSSLMEKINSLIIEGDANVTEQVTEEIEEMRRDADGKKRKWTSREINEIDKYIIFGSEVAKPGTEEVPLNIPTLTENPLEINGEVLKDELVLEAMDTKNICSHCSMVFATRVNLRRHLSSVHNVPVRTRTREKVTPKRETLKKYIAMLNKKLKNNQMLCQVCGHVSKSSGGAKYHSLTHGERMFTCPKCSKSFFTPSHLKHHLQVTHSTEKGTHLCPLCGECRNSATALTYHMKVHTMTEKQHRCDICGLKFMVKSALNNHLRRHNGDRRYSCEVCGKSFYTSNELKKHLMIHTGERPHQCNYCEKRFVTPFNLKVHMMTHDGPFLCEFCHKGFVDVDILNVHLRHKHRVTIPDSQDLPQSGDEENSIDGQLLEEFNLLPPEDSLDFEGD